jgi:hypothetical protein
MTDVLIFGFSVFAVLMALVSLYVSSRNRVDESFKDKFIIYFTVNKNDKQKMESFKDWAAKEGIDIVDKTENQEKIL